MQRVRRVACIKYDQNRIFNKNSSNLNTQYTMNAALKLRIANFITLAVTVLTVIQTNLTHPPFEESFVFFWGSFIAITVPLLTIVKQKLSPEVSNTAATVSWWITGAALLTGAVDYLDIINWPADVEQRIRWVVTVAVMSINILSKQLFPSDSQKMNMKVLKYDK